MSKTGGNRSNRVSRRQFLWTLGAIPASGALFDGSSLASAGPTGTPARSTPLFEEIPPSVSGISWRHVNGRSRMAHLPETVGAGCAFFDYDNDGWMDIYLVNSGPCDFYAPPRPLANALYRNNRDGTFTDVTEEAGVGGNAYGMGVAAGDYDGDGFQDLYVTQYPHSLLYHNNGDGTFTDVTAKAGVQAPGWATSAVWFDYDNDGRLDLFVCRFVDYAKDKLKFCGDKLTGERSYCIPTIYDPMPCWLFHNHGDGTFTDVSKQSGISEALAKAWGVVAADINNDGRMDLYVTNDTVPNFLFVNRGRGKFEEIAMLAGAGVSVFGKPRSGMGVDAGDYDQDGWIDLFEANVDHEMYSLYHNDRNEAFSDVALSTGIGEATRMMSGWGLKFLDIDNDGNLDLLLANGHPDDKVDKKIAGVAYREPMLLFRNDGRSLKNVSAESGPIFSEPLAGRGLALGDFDNDGSVDVLVTQNNAAPVLLRNNAGRENHWLGLRLVGRKANIDAIGAKVSLRSGDLERHVYKVGGGSYLSSHDPRMVLGLGQRTKIDWLEVKWPEPSGKIERFTGLPIDRYITIFEGEGRWK
ncbi:MAG: CRTAC1 family protein [Acidobacteria bacterium]|nr:CRTAC1 family protein [Acidobacteriota bacterium]